MLLFKVAATLLIFLLLPTLNAQTQSHPLSEITPIDANLNMNSYSIVNAVWMNASKINTSLICLSDNCQSSWPLGGGWTMSGNYLYNATSNVKVGIGTNSPQEQLHVAENILAGGALLGNSLEINGGFDGNGLTIDSSGNILTKGNLTYSGYTYIIDILRFNGTVEAPFGIKGGYIYPGTCNGLSCMQTTYYLFSEGNIINSSTYFAAPAFYESGSSLANKYVSRNDWTTHDNYPPECPSGQFVVGIGDTLSCQTPSSSSSGWVMSGDYLYNATSNVKVGIGTSTPTVKLEVAGDVAAASFKDRDDSQYYIDPSDVSILKNLQISSGVLTGLNSESIYIGATDNVISFISGGSEIMRIHSNGNFGIGTLAPVKKFEVVGDANITQNLIVGQKIKDVNENQRIEFSNGDVIIYIG